MPDNLVSSVSATSPSPLSPSEILRLRALKEAMGGFAHEVSQPLNAIMIASQVVKMVVEKSTLSVGERNFILQRLEILTSQVRKAGKIIDTLRHFMRGYPGTAENTNLSEVIQFVLSLMGQQLSARGIQLVQKIEDKPLLTTLDRNTIECILIAGIAFARDAVELLAIRREDETSPYEKILEIETGLSNQYLLVHLHWPNDQEGERDDPSNAVSNQELQEVRQVMSSSGGKINVLQSGLILEFPAVG